MKILHVGCGGGPLPPQLVGDETRLDIDPAVQPDIVASMTDMGDIGTYDLIFCSHTLEHLHPRDVGIALREFLRVLEPGGAAIVLVPDLEDTRPTDEVLFVSAAGPITGHQLFYGHVSSADNPFMAHHSGFIASTLLTAFEKAGFARTVVTRAASYNLVAGGLK